MNITRPVKSVLTGIEKQHKDLRNERGVIVDATGKILINKAGAADQVAFSFIETMWLLLRNLRGKRDIFTHNHPQDAQLSLTDIKMAVLHMFREMRATTPEGKLHIMELPKKFSLEDSKRAILLLDHLFHLEKPQLKDLLNPFFFIKKLERYRAQHFTNLSREQRKLIQKAIPGIRFRTLPIEGGKKAGLSGNPIEQVLTQIKRGGFRNINLD